MTETIVLDPSSGSGPATGRTQLDITAYVKADGINWGDAEIQAYTAQQAVGEARVHYRLPNRQIQIPLALRLLGGTSFATIRSNIQQKAGLFQREGGWIMRQVGATPLYADVQSATLHLGGSWLQAYRDVDVDAVLSLECLPDWYGDEVTLSDHVETTLPHLFFTEATINGNYPGRVRLVVDNDQATDQLGLLWGFQSRYYNAGTTAALFYEAEGLVPLNGGTTGALTGASGGTAVYHSMLPGGVWVPMLQMAMRGGTTALTHQGSYRAWARCWGGTVTPQFRLQWGRGGLSTPITNQAKQVAGTANFYMLDLGSMRIDTPSVGTNTWGGVIQAQVPSDNLQVAIDSVYLQPLDDGAGKLTYVPSLPASSIETVKSATVAVNDAANGGAAAWSNLNYITAEDSSYVNTTVTGNPAGTVNSQYCKGTGFGFTIPSGATIRGIQVLQYTSPLAPPDNGGFGFGFVIVKAGVVQPAIRPTVQSHATYGADDVWILGGPTDLWGTTWAPSDINNSGFGMAVYATTTFVTGTFVAGINWYQCAVWYTLSSGLTVAQDAVAYASQSVQLGTDGIFREDPTGTVWAPVSGVIGDLPRVPPSGSESRTMRTFLKFSRGDFDGQPDSGIDDISAKIFYRPSYLITP